MTDPPVLITVLLCCSRPSSDGHFGINKFKTLFSEIMSGN